MYLAIKWIVGEIKWTGHFKFVRDHQCVHATTTIHNDKVCSSREPQIGSFLYDIAHFNFRNPYLEYIKMELQLKLKPCADF